MNQERIGSFIKTIRQDNKLTQKELADKLGVTYQAVSKWENGTDAHAFTSPGKRARILLGASSQDIRLKKRIRL